MNSSAVFKEDVDIVPVVIDDTLSYMPWGGDNNMPFDILKLIEDDETLSTCQMFNAEVCFGSGLRYDTCLASAAVKSEVEDFFLNNDIASYYLGVCQDFKHFGFAVVVAACRHKCQQCERNDKGFQCKFYFFMLDFISSLVADV